MKMFKNSSNDLDLVTILRSFKMFQNVSTTILSIVLDFDELDLICTMAACGNSSIWNFPSIVLTQHK